MDYSGTDSVAVRVVRSGTMLEFEWREQGLWNTQFGLELPADATADKGGIFASTDAAIGFAVDFDYVMLVDPSLGERSALAQVLQMSEVMYNPQGSSDYEFLELQNVGAQAIELEGIQFPRGQPFDELTLSQTMLAPGAFGLLVSNISAFRERYGNGLDARIIGEWSGGNLRNSGETITLIDSAGDTIHTFAYGDSAPWPAEADGEGASLVLIDPASAPDHGNAANWRASTKINGSPGEEDAAPEPGLLDYALGADLLGVPAESLVAVQVSETGGQEYLAFTYVKRTDAEGINFIVEVSTDLENWSSGDNLVNLSTIDNGNGTTTITTGSPFDQVNGSTNYMRLRVEQQE
ncbi:MAG: hypothetical protein ACI9R3_004010 [Verrucomicrobiales bacterium]